jgi:hypothetical protein
MKIIILSKDRAAQLDLCLEALYKHNKGVFDTVSVIYTSSTPEFTEGYNKVQSYYPDVSWIQQTNYKKNVLTELDSPIHALASFLTDDDIFYRDMEVDQNYFNQLFADVPDLACFSLRLGLNTVVQDPYNNIPTVPPTSGFAESDGKVYWKWRDVPNYMNFGYPLSVDGHIFRVDDLWNVHHDLEFNNPNQQEVSIQRKNDTLPGLMGCFKQSVVINTPLNRVQDTCMNRAGELFGCPANVMNARYLAGEKLDLSSIDFSNIVGCHQELEIKWTTR